jgi:hypothetical protein
VIKWSSALAVKIAGKLLRSLPGTSTSIGPPRQLCQTLAAYVQLGSSGGRCTYLELQPGEQANRILPSPRAEGIDSRFYADQHRTLPSAGLAIIPGGRVLTTSGIVVAPPDYLISEVAPSFLNRDPNTNPIFLSIKLPKLEKITCSVAVLTSRYSQNYFHWLFDTLPRLKLLQDSGVHYERIVAPCQMRYQFESLDAIGHLRDKLLDPSLLHVEATQLLVPTLPGFSGNPPKWACQFLRESFLSPLEGKRPKGKGRKIYISRWRCGTRKVLNEPELLDSLQPMGFDSVSLEDLSFLEQVRLFADTEVVVGAHGAGLSNLVFCNPGARVVELFSPSYIRTCYWAVANQVGLNYDYAVGKSSSKNRRANGSLVHENFEAEISQILEAIKPMHSRVKPLALGSIVSV